MSSLFWSFFQIIFASKINDLEQVYRNQ